MYIEDDDGPRKHIIIGEFAPSIPGLADIYLVTKWSSTNTREVLTLSSSSSSQIVSLLSPTVHDADLGPKEFLLPFDIKNLDKSS